jgi:hypothetical protein
MPIRPLQFAAQAISPCSKIETYTVDIQFLVIKHHGFSGYENGHRFAVYAFVLFFVHVHVTVHVHGFFRIYFFGGSFLIPQLGLLSKIRTSLAATSIFFTTNLKVTLSFDEKTDSRFNSKYVKDTKISKSPI